MWWQVIDSFHTQVFGLGNKTYEHYNEIARIIDKKLEELGAERVYKRGEGDDDAKYVVIATNTHTLIM